VTQLALNVAILVNNAKSRPLAVQTSRSLGDHAHMRLPMCEW